jgi:hypothetical protein
MLPFSSSFFLLSSSGLVHARVPIFVIVVRASTSHFYFSFQTMRSNANDNAKHKNNTKKEQRESKCGAQFRRKGEKNRAGESGAPPSIEDCQVGADAGRGRTRLQMETRWQNAAPNAQI